MNTCKDCRYWRDENWLLADSLFEEAGKRVCEAANEVGTLEGRTSLDVYAVTTGKADVDSCLITGPDFGCVLFAAK
jgi:hypothetical protein